MSDESNVKTTCNMTMSYEDRRGYEYNYYVCMYMLIIYTHVSQLNDQTI